jgi:N6-adenosine-specific RNA methylase IME4
MTRYRTIVADPPWDYPEGFAGRSRTPGKWEGPVIVKPLPYDAMTFDDICELPVRKLADRDCRLFLWTTNRYLDDAFDVMHAWGFKYRQTLVWNKRDGNLGGSVAASSVEFLLVGTRGAPARLSKLASAVLTTAAPKQHSRKPDAWLDYIEQVSPGPYVELFARRARFGWDYWGDESLNTAEMSARNHA